VKAQGRIFILDRSVLAGNLYRLLLAPLGYTLVVRRRFEDFRALFTRREKVDLAILNSNAFGKKSDEIIGAVESDAAMGRCRKLFLLKEGESEGPLKGRVQKLKGARVIDRPFHPDEFMQEVAGIVGGDR